MAIGPTEVAEGYNYEAVQENYVITDNDRILRVYYVQPLQHVDGMRRRRHGVCDETRTMYSSHRLPLKLSTYGFSIGSGATSPCSGGRHDTQHPADA